MKYQIKKYQNPSQGIQRQDNTRVIPQSIRRVPTEQEENQERGNNYLKSLKFGTPEYYKRQQQISGQVNSVSPEFALLTGGVGAGLKLGTSIGSKLASSAIYGGTQGAIWNLSNLASKQDAKGLGNDIIGGAVTGGLLKGTGIGIGKAVSNIPGIGVDAPDLGYHALNKDHWALHPRQLDPIHPMSTTNLGLYGMAAANRLMPILKKTPLIHPIKKVAERIMEQGSNPRRTPNEILQGIFSKRLSISPQYTGSVMDLSEFKPNLKRNLNKLYLYGDETGFEIAGNDVQKIDFGDRYNKLYSNTKFYKMKAEVPPNEPIPFEDWMPKTRSLLYSDVNPIQPLDNISGHQVKFIPGKTPIFITQDLWKMNPKDYVQSWGEDGWEKAEDGHLYIDMSNLRRKLITEKQAGLLDKVGKPFYLVQNNPVEMPPDLNFTNER